MIESTGYASFDAQGWVPVVLSIVTLLGVIVNAIIQRSQEVRRREWELQDRQQREQSSVERSEKLHEEIKAARTTIGNAIAANTAVTVQTQTAVKANAADAIEVAKKVDEALDKKLEALGVRVRTEKEARGA